MTNKEFFIQRWKRELRGTLNALKALPSDMEALNYRHDNKARTAIQIVQHIMPHAEHLAAAIETGIVDERDMQFNSATEAAEYYEKATEALVNKLENVDNETWETKTLTLMINGRKIFDASMMDMSWGLLFDTIHHRGQLSTYYRSMGVRNPSIYGPSAEDIEEMLAASKN